MLSGQALSATVNRSKCSTHASLCYCNSFMTEVPIIWNKSIDLLCKSMDWFLDDRDSRHERLVSQRSIKNPVKH